MTHPSLFIKFLTKQQLWFICIALVQLSFWFMRSQLPNDFLIFLLLAKTLFSVHLPVSALTFIDFLANLEDINISFALGCTDDQIWTSLQVGNLDEKNTEKIQGGTTFEESISLLIYDLANDKVCIHALDILTVDSTLLLSYLTQLQLSWKMKKIVFYIFLKNQLFLKLDF